MNKHQRAMLRITGAIIFFFAFVIYFGISASYKNEARIADKICNAK